MNLGLVQTRPAGGAGVSDHSLLSNLGYAAAAHTGFCSLATAQTITAEKLIGSAVGLRFGHAAGPLLQGPAAGDLLKTVGRAEITPTDDWAGGSTTVLRAYETLAADGTRTLLELGAASGLGMYTGLQFIKFTASSLGLAPNAVVSGLYAQVIANVNAASASGTMRGLNFQAGVGAGGAGVITTEVAPIYARVYIAGYTGSITNAFGLHVDNLFIVSSPSGTVARSTGIKVKNVGSARATDAVGLDIDDITLNTGLRYLIQAGPATPNLRLLANAPPNAGLATEGDSQLFLAWMENGVVNLRRVRWRAQASLGAADKVLIAA